jgi:hypothetical protein
MTPLQYIRLINLLEKYKPKRICELGSGQSTDIFNVYAKKENATAYSIEHDMFYNTHNSIMFPIVESTQLSVNCHKYETCTKYDGLELWLEKEDKFDFVFIDAPNDGVPFNPLGLKYARVQTLDFVLMNKLANESIVMYHDSERESAKNTLVEFERLLDEYGFSYEKEMVIEKDKEIIEYNKKILGVCPELTIYKIKK